MGTLESRRATFKWTLDYYDLARCEGPGDYTSSPKFHTWIKGAKFKWKLNIYPRSKDDEYPNHISLYLESYTYTRIHVHTTLQLLYNHDQIKKFECYQFFHNNELGKADFVERELVIDEANARFLGNDKIVVLCQMDPQDGSEIDEIEEMLLRGGSDLTQQQKLENSCRIRAFDKLEEAMDDDQFADVSFKVRGKVFKAHRVILATASRVFAACFEHEMREKKDNVVEIDDIEPGVFEELLRFMYTGRVRDLESMAEQLLVAADKYELDSLQDLCGNVMCKSLSVDNAIKYLKFANMHNARDLRQRVIKYIVANASRMVQQPDYESIIHENPAVLFEIIKSLSLKNK
ncbi:hypothetical protein QAD02_012088 [Eretmocerus hayati]|uniref:Uncharacterized protein n=1 Tax=Eretmocerus hayati TaxID=131215 RepID=A0ACC2P0E7_9HYME|nr:hypothetical protein QAD02_012088 [Eretmocerus hayati]